MIQKMMTMRMIEELPVRGAEVPRITLPIAPIRACGLFGNVEIKSSPNKPTTIQASTKEVLFQITFFPFRNKYNFHAKFFPDVLKEIPLQRKKLTIYDLGETLELQTGHLVGEVDKLSGHSPLPDRIDTRSVVFPIDFEIMQKVYRALRYLKHKGFVPVTLAPDSLCFSVKTIHGECLFTYFRPKIQRRKERERF